MTARGEIKSRERIKGAIKYGGRDPRGVAAIVSGTT